MDNIFSIGSSYSDFLIWGYIFQEQTSFKGVVCNGYLYEFNNFHSRKKVNKKEVLISKVPILVIAGRDNISLSSIKEEAKKYTLEKFSLDLHIIEGVDQQFRVEDVSRIISWCLAKK